FHFCSNPLVSAVLHLLVDGSQNLGILKQNVLGSLVPCRMDRLQSVASTRKSSDIFDDGNESGTLIRYYMLPRCIFRFFRNVNIDRVDFSITKKFLDCFFISLIDIDQERKAFLIEEVIILQHHQNLAIRLEGLHFLMIIRPHLHEANYLLGRGEGDHLSVRFERSHHLLVEGFVIGLIGRDIFSLFIISRKFVSSLCSPSIVCSRSFVLSLIIGIFVRRRLLGLRIGFVFFLDIRILLFFRIGRIGRFIFLKRILIVLLIRILVFHILKVFDLGRTGKPRDLLIRHIEKVRGLLHGLVILAFVLVHRLAHSFLVPSSLDIGSKLLQIPLCLGSLEKDGLEKAAQMACGLSHRKSKLSVLGREVGIGTCLSKSSALK